MAEQLKVCFLALNRIAHIYNHEIYTQVIQEIY
jgi:hypothetical protein